MPPRYKTEKYLAKALRRLRSFYREDPESQCWIWTGRFKVPNKKYTYGMFSFGMKWRLAHRVSYALHNDRIDLLDKPYIICMHTCDDPRCINPRHIKLGTTVDNSHDRREKGRYRVCPHCNKSV